MLTVLAAGLGLAALGTILWWSRATLWRPEKSNVLNEPAKIESNSSVKTVEQKVPDFALGNPEPKPVSLRAKPSDSSTRANEATIKDHANPPKQEVHPISLSKGASSKKADGGVDPGPPVLPGLVANNAPTIIRDIPVATPGRPPESPKVSFGLVQARLIRQVNPRYPPQAEQARIEGTIVLQGVIGKDGSVRELRPLSGSPLLIAAAMDAVRQWRYKPYQLNGKPVEGETQISVKFTLNK
jgi:TonB family protein